MEFALGWPIVLLLVLGSVQLAVWESEAAAAHDAALAGARAGTVAGATEQVASGVALRALSGSLIGVRAVPWCPSNPLPVPTLWVCAIDEGPTLQVDVGGSVPALVPLVPGKGLPVRAHVLLNKEAFAR